MISIAAHLEHSPIGKSGNDWNKDKRYTSAPRPTLRRSKKLGTVRGLNLNATKIVGGIFSFDYFIIVVDDLVLVSLLKVERALETCVAECTLLRVDNAAGSDHDVFSLHFGALQPSLRDDTFDGCRAHFIILRHLKVSGELMRAAIQVVERLDLGNAGCRLVQFDHLSSIFAAPDVSTDKSCHVENDRCSPRGRYPFGERSIGFVLSSAIRHIGAIAGTPMLLKPVDQVHLVSWVGCRGAIRRSNWRDDTALYGEPPNGHERERNRPNDQTLAKHHILLWAESFRQYLTDGFVQPCSMIGV